MATATEKTPGPKPDMYIVEGNFHARIDGSTAGELVLPLKVPYRTFKKLMDISENNSLDDLERFIDELGIGSAKQTLDEAEDTVQVLAAAMGYFAKFQEIAEARLGEFVGSSSA